jgi:hypothetical protein
LLGSGRLIVFRTAVWQRSAAAARECLTEQARKAGVPTFWYELSARDMEYLEAEDAPAVEANGGAFLVDWIGQVDLLAAALEQFPDFR